MPRTKFFIDDPMGRNMIQVLSRAPLETILLHTTNVTGEIELDTDNILRQPSVSLSVPVDSLDTGIPLMNEVLRRATGGSMAASSRRSDSPWARCSRRPRPR